MGDLPVTDNILPGRQRLSDFLDRLIPALLARRVIQVVISGEDLSTLPATLDCLDALHGGGYLLRLAFSHSARHSSLQAACLDGLALRQITVICDNASPDLTQDEYCQLYLPALSTNSMSKITLGIRDNLACRWAFHALSQKKPVIITRNADASTFAPALQACLSGYAATLTAYGFTVIGYRAAEKHTRRLLTLGDIRQLPPGASIHLDTHTLITPAARDEIRARGIVLTQTS